MVWKILGIDYSTQEVLDLIFFIVIVMTLPIGITKQLYLCLKSNQEDNSVPLSPAINKKSNQKKKKSKSR